MKKNVLSVFFLFMSGVSFGQQEALFTHYTFNSLAINPAYAGSRNAMTVTALHRSQWVGFEGAPITQTVTIHAPLFNGKMGFGLSAIHDKIGPTRSTSIALDYAYKIRFNRKSQLALGVKGGFNTMQTNLLALTTIQPGDNAASTGQQGSATVNMGTGAYYYSDVWYAGVSVPKLFENKMSSITTSRAVQQRHFYFIFGFAKNLSKQVLLKPSMLVRATKGAPVQADFTALFTIDKRFDLGGFFRTGDALGVLAGFNVRDHFRIGYSFDWSYGMNSGSYNSGSHEIVLRYDFIQVVKSPVVSPRHF